MKEERLQYYTMLAEDFEVELDTVLILAELLGENEDYDGLITALEDLEQQS